MWMIILVTPVVLGLLIMALFGYLHNRKVDKYEEWKKQQEQRDALVPGNANP